jgi:hypothetical protein
MSAGVTAVSQKLPINLWTRLRLASIDFRIRCRSLLRSWFGELLCRTAGNIS